MPIIAGFLAIFKMWMLFDALQRCGRRCNNNYWFLICWVPFGDWVYFFAVKIHDPEFKQVWGKAFTRPATLEDVRYQANHSPSLVNKVSLCKALIDADKFAEADELLSELSKANPNEREIVFLLAICRSRAGNKSQAIETFETLIVTDLSCFDYKAADELASLYWSAERKNDAVELLNKMFKKSHRISHQVELAKSLYHLERKDEAKEVLQTAMQDYKHAPKFVKRQYRSAAREAQSMLRAFS